MKRLPLLLILILCACAPQQQAVIFLTLTPSPEMLIAPKGAAPTQGINLVAQRMTEMSNWTPTPILSEVSSRTCRIKGNVSKRNKDQKIYHCPNWPDYAETDVNASEGDQWFCSEAEAIAAGFRKPLNVSSPCYP